VAVERVIHGGEQETRLPPRAMMSIACLHVHIRRGEAVAAHLGAYDHGGDGEMVPERGAGGGQLGGVGGVEEVGEDEEADEVRPNVDGLVGPRTDTASKQVSECE
jgi:hypothetical protein